MIQHTKTNDAKTNEAAVETLRHSGDVFMFDSETDPNAVLRVAAILRYQVGRNKRSNYKSGAAVGGVSERRQQQGHVVVRT